MQIVAPLCPICSNRRWVVSERSDGRRAVERCDSCSMPLADTDAAKLAQAAGVQCSSTYPCILLEDLEE